VIVDIAQDILSLIQQQYKRRTGYFVKWLLGSFSKFLLKSFLLC